MDSSRAHEHVERVEKGQNGQGLEKRQELISLVRIRFHIWRRRNDQDSRVKRDSGLRQGSKTWRHEWITKEKQERPKNERERKTHGGSSATSPVASLSEAVDSRESSASRIRRTRLSGMPPARRNLAAIQPFD
ncbi:hypothetical protein B296_00004755 [Ensete ventricosum]|uniref:Uncharacterized protein n=1 Tax=Ensete ventricosum TaxID=4639 RepID=A0A427BC03_ENSVE|nr:hypothetical protein B296_00004755 [Ensete ventricosum]